MTSPVALFRHFPALQGQLRWVDLGTWPSPVEAMPALAERLHAAELYIKREDCSSPRFGGNKVRTLESIFGHAQEAGADRIWTTGAYGSNHAVAMALHADLAGLQSGVLLFPQPPTDTAVANCLALIASGTQFETMMGPVSLPFAMLRKRIESRRGPERHYVMPPGGAIPRGSLAHVSAALELAEQVDAGAMPAPRRIVLAVGSTCTSAGLLLGVEIAARLGIGWGPSRGAPVPIINAVRVTPWPITGPSNIARLARNTSRWLTGLVGPIASVRFRALRRGLDVDGAEFGGGYGKPIYRGAEARRLFAECGGPPLDQVYTEKSAASFIAHARNHTTGPLLYWATRSSTELPVPTPEQIAAAPPEVRAWLDKPRTNLPRLGNPPPMGGADA